MYHKCAKCQEKKHRVKFRPKKSKGKDGKLNVRPGSYCYECEKERSRERARNTPQTFESRYKLLLQGSQRGKRELYVDLTLDDYSAMMELARCHYCDLPVQWTGVYKSYNVDRKDNKDGYSKENSVPCCTVCNRVRGHFLSYEEMVKLGPAMREIYDERIAKDPTKYRV